MRTKHIKNRLCALVVLKTRSFFSPKTLKSWLSLQLSSGKTTSFSSLAVQSRLILFFLCGISTNVNKVHIRATCHAKSQYCLPGGLNLLDKV